MQPIIIYEGPSNYDGNPIVVTACLSGNSATGRTLDLTVAPLNVVEAVRAVEGKGFARGKAYTQALKESIKSVCHGSCGHYKFVDGELVLTCYVQGNVRVAGQPAKQLAEAVRPPNYREAWKSLCKMAKLSGFSMVRLCVAGSSGAIPKDTIEWIMGDAEKEGLGRLAYVENHRSKGAQHLKGTHMASVQTMEQAKIALKNGWGVFFSMPVYEFEGGFKMPKGAEFCGKSAEAKEVHGLPITCDSCGLCDGTNFVIVPSHSSGDGARKRSKRMQGVEIRSSTGQLVGRFPVLA